MEKFGQKKNSWVRDLCSYNTIVDEFPNNKNHAKPLNIGVNALPPQRMQISTANLKPQGGRVLRAHQPNVKG
jgi:hypothetical protein